MKITKIHQRNALSIITAILLLLTYSGSKAQSNILYSSDFKDGLNVYTINLAKSGNRYLVEIDDKSSNNKKQFTSTLSSIDDFKLSFDKEIKQLNNALTASKTAELASRFFYELKTAISIGNDDKVIAGTIFVNHKFPLDPYEGNQDSLSIDEISIVFKDGFIEDIQLIATSRDNPILTKTAFSANKNSKTNERRKLEIQQNTRFIFDNVYPIGISSKHALAKNNLYLFDRINNVTVDLKKIISYTPNINLDTKDYSPKNGKIILRGGDKKSLEKSSYNRILEVVAFTDFFGINNDNPNGLVQFDFTKTLAINTVRESLVRSVNGGIMNHLELKGQISKIEENNRRLVPSRKTIVSDTSIMSSESYVSSLDLLNYQIYSLGADLNLLTLDLPSVKSKFDIFLGFRYGRNTVQDSSVTFNDGQVILNGDVQEFGTNSTAFIPKIRYQLFSESRFGLLAEAGFHFLRLRNDNLSQVDNEVDFLTGTESAQIEDIFQFLIQIRYRNQTDSGNLFLRYQFSNLLGKIERNFSQLQLGYTFDIFSGKRQL